MRLHLETRMFALLPFATYISDDTLETGIGGQRHHGD